MRQSLIFACLCFASVSCEVLASDKSPCQVHLILFVPADVDPPTDYQPRVDEIVEYAESFFQREFKRWGHRNIVMPFRRSADGHVEVTMMRGKKKTTEYKPVSVRSEVMQTNRGKNKLSGGRQVWWILMYRGAFPVKSSFLGGFGRRIGGWAVCNLDLTPGRVDPKAELGSEFLKKLALKGMLHELGHGFQLPHIGPLRQDDSGNTLMGPTHFNYRRVARIREERVYLSQAEAAILTTHPAFQGVADNPGPLPKINVQNMTYRADRKKNAFVVSGRLFSNKRAAYALVGDESDARPGEYWTKTYAGKVSSNGEFEVVVSEPSESNGTLKLWFVFEGGTQTGNGKSRGRDSGIPKAYTYRRKQWKFN
jgi:hypothetical protein